jgi:starch synthase
VKILFAGSEALPHFKTGGLADVARSLPDALAARGHDVRIIMPGFHFLHDATADAVADADLALPWPGGPVRTSVAVLDGADGTAPTAFVRTPGIFDTDRPYEAPPADPLGLARRYAFFCRAVVHYATHWDADVVHLNDWQTGLVPAYALADGLHAATLFAIHNLAYQGNFPAAIMHQVGLPATLFRMENGLEFHGQVSFMKAGIALADRLATVSPTYAREIQTPLYGNGLDGLLAFRRRLLHGILNGIDTRAWNPTTDPLLPATYNGRTLTRKAASRAALLERAGLDGDGPVLGVVSRLVHQKGIELIMGAMPELLAAGCRIVVLGSGEPAFEHAIASRATATPDRVAFRPGFDEPLAHLIYAGADFFLMPSLYEPCGLGQMIAQRYGTPPIARRTGGLNDTVRDGVTGFLFDEPSAASLADAVRRATAIWQRRGWRSLQSRCMREDHSWTRSAAEYEKVYELALGAVAAPAPVHPHP